ncbi:MAG: phenylacetate--CoA ligase [Firmicutes bacterium]|nr:phenylacetate--CoA ligase [Bacillota bacterium]
MIWDKRHETMSRDEMRALQLTRLQALVERVYRTSPFYRKLWDEAGVKPEQVKTLDDIRRFPFTTKDMLRQNYPYGMFAVPLSKIVRLHASSGTMGQSTVVGYTRRDLRIWADMVARVAVQAGVTRRDIAQISFGYGLFTGGFGLHYGLERVGATVLPVSSGNTQRQIQLMQDFGTTVLVGTPSYALHMAEVAEEMGVDTSKLKLRLGLFGAEPWTEAMRAEIEKRWHIKATDNYGLSEITGPGVAGECEYGGKMHISEDHFFPEVIDSKTGEPLPPGEEGELVFTTLTKEGIPLVRYRTRDISSLDYSPCPCGRATVRMKKVTGRSDDMLIIRGVNIFPSQIEAVLMNIDGVGPQYQIIVDRKGFMDDIEVIVELSKEGFTGSWRDLEALENKVKERLENALSLRPGVKLVEYMSLERSMGKAKRVIDRRKLTAS